MTQIWKFPLKWDHGWQTVEAPAFAHVLTVGEQQGTLCVWMRVSTHTPVLAQRFFVAFTGADLPNEVDFGDAELIGRAEGHGLVVHVFAERGRRRIGK